MIIRTIIALLLLCSPVMAGNVVMMGGGVASVSSTTNFCNDSSVAGCWFMNSDGSTNELDRSGNNYNLIVSSGNTIQRAVDVPSGYSGYSRDFEYDDTDYLYRTEASGLSKLDINGSDAKVSICAWVKHESITNANDGCQGIVSKFDVNNGQYTLMLSRNADDVTWSTFYIIGRIYYAGGSYDEIKSTNYYNIGTWYHICLTDDNLSIKLYVNGSSAAPTMSHTSGIFNGNGTFYIGSMFGDYSEYDGLIDDVIVLSRGLSESEVQEIYNNGIDGTRGSSD